MTPPVSNLFEFMDFRKFLEDYHARRQAQDKGFTRSRFCKELGLPNTRSYFNDIVKGSKPLSATYAERFVLVMGMEEDEARYFRVLVDFNQSVYDKEREQLFDQLVALNRTPKRLVIPEQYEFYRHWHHTTVFALLQIVDFSEDYGGLARNIYPPITAGQARESIALLEKLGLIARDAAGFWKPTSKTLDSGSYAKNELVTQYQLQCLELSKRAMLMDQDMARNFSTVTLSVSRKGYALIEKKLQQFKAEVRSIAHRETAPAEQVYQLNIQCFPQSRLEPK